MPHIELLPIKPGEDRSPEIFWGKETQDILSAFDTFYERVGFDPPWIGYFILMNNAVVGSCGFKGKPLDKSVEIAYTTFARHERLGIATEACRCLVQRAFHTDPELTVSAKTLTDNFASHRILEKNGFRHIADGFDEKDQKEIWIWTIEKPLEF